MILRWSSKSIWRLKMNRRNVPTRVESVFLNLFLESSSAVAWESKIMWTYLGTRWLQCSKSTGSSVSGWKPEEFSCSRESSLPMIKIRKTSIWIKMMMERTFSKISTTALKMNGSGTLFVRRTPCLNFGVSLQIPSQSMLCSQLHLCSYSRNFLRIWDHLRCLLMYASHLIL